MLEIRLEKSPIAQVSHLGVRVCGDLLVNVDIVFAELIHQVPSKVSCVGNVGDFLHFRWQWEVDKISNSGKDDVLKAHSDSQCP